MNTGLHGVWNLVWKLALAIHQRARQELLDSYTAERRPVIRRVIEITDVMTRALGAPSRFAQGIRDIAIPVASRLAPVQRGMVQALSGLGIAYHGSPIVEGPGERYFDGSLRGGGIGSRFLLFTGADDRSPAVAGVRQRADDFRDVLQLRTGLRRGITLVHPDGYTAYESRGDAAPAALDHVRKVLQRQVVGLK
jgi:hypothetical protein